MQKLKRVIIWGTILAIFYFFIHTITENWKNLQTYKFQLNPALFIISLLLLNISIFLFALLWRDILHRFSKKRISVRDCFFIQLTAWFARYIPGKVGLVLVKFYQAKKRKIDNSTVAFSLIYENIFQILASFVISITFLSYFFLKTSSLYLKIAPILFIFLIIIFLQPKIFYSLVNCGLKLLKKKQIQRKYFLNEKQIFYYLSLYSIPILLTGIAFHLMINSIMHFNHILISIGTISFASVIGLLAIFAPSGLGVREGIIVLILKGFMPIELATLVSLLARVWAVLADVLLGLYLLIYKSYLKLIKKEKV